MEENTSNRIPTKRSILFIPSIREHHRLFEISSNTLNHDQHREKKKPHTRSDHQPSESIHHQRRDLIHTLESPIQTQTENVPQSIEADFERTKAGGQSFEVPVRGVISWRQLLWKPSILESDRTRENKDSFLSNRTTND